MTLLEDDSRRTQILLLLYNKKAKIAFDDIFCFHDILSVFIPFRMRMTVLEG